MDVPPQSIPGPKTTFTVLVTGANSGLGFAICCRLIDEFLFTRPQSQTLHLLFSTRDARKGADTTARLHAHLQRTLRAANHGRAAPKGLSLLLEARVNIENVLVDLLKLSTVRALATQLLQRRTPLDAVVCNAGVAGWLGLNWPCAIYSVLTNLVHNTTYPRYLNCDVGALARPQAVLSPFAGAGAGAGAGASPPEPALGEVFTANVFGHYLLVHWLAPLLAASSSSSSPSPSSSGGGSSSSSGGRVIWTSSISAVAETFDATDLQGVRNETAYEASKRLTDLLVLTSELPSTRPFVDEFLAFGAERRDGAQTTTTTTNGDDGKGTMQQRRPIRMYVTHPGVVGTAISGLHWVLDLFMVAAFYLARWMGSPWHGVTAYKGAVAATFAVLAPREQLEELEEREGKGKWGSAVGVFGDERVARTEVEGWGFCGRVGVVPRGSVTGATGRYRGQVETTRERRQEFEEMGRGVWREMEEMRKEWEKRLGDVEVKVETSVDL